MTFHKILTSAANDDLKHLGRLLANARDRRKHGQLVLEGIHLLQSALDAGLATPEHAAFVAKLAAAKKP